MAPQDVEEGMLLWEPSEKRKALANITRYLTWLDGARGLRFGSYEELWVWSVQDLEGFWSSIWEFFGISAHHPYHRVLGRREMPNSEWFPGATLNYAEHILCRRDDHPAIVAHSEARAPRSVSYAELANQVASAQEGLRRLGVGRGDRVVALAPNIPETLVAFLATSSLGAVWSSCAPEFGIRAVVSRFTQLEPKVLLAVDGYRYAGKAHDRLDAIAQIQDRLVTLEATVVIPYLDRRPDLRGLRNVVVWEELIAQVGHLDFEPVPFDHPLWILYSSGTTGPPKGIVHGHGGILLELYKVLALHSDLGSEDRFFWFTTTGWVMWNYLVSGLLLGATAVLYDGSPAYPDLGALWRLAENTRATYFGTSAPYIQTLMRAGVEPGRQYDLDALRSIGSTGASLRPEAFAWIYRYVKGDLHLASVSGGTDVATAFLSSCPLLPVQAGELQCRALGAKVEAFNEDGKPVIDQVGELVITEPMPSMPVFFWADPDGRRYQESYFEAYQGVWRHGDWIKITPRGSAVIYGRSDSTLNQGGVRMGTAEFYRVVEEIPGVVDSLVIDTGRLGDEGQLLLYVVLEEGKEFTPELVERIRRACREELSPRHVPDEIHAAPDLPRTLSGKKLEIPIKKILAGSPPEQTVRRDALANPDSLQFFMRLARD